MFEFGVGKLEVDRGGEHEGQEEGGREKEEQRPGVPLEQRGQSQPNHAAVAGDPGGVAFLVGLLYMSIYGIQLADYPLPPSPLEEEETVCYCCYWH